MIIELKPLKYKGWTATFVRFGQMIHWSVYKGNNTNRRNLYEDGDERNKKDAVWAAKQEISEAIEEMSER